MSEHRFYRSFGKRLLDLAVVLLLLFPLLLVGAFIAVTLKIINGSPVLFVQARPGLNGRLFPIYKFRTMTNKRDRQGVLLPDSQRLTPIGRFLRATSLDELPQFYNVLKGDMSLIGPRPLLPEYVGRYTAEQKRRHEVKPGLSGWAQVHGRERLSRHKKCEYDVWYVQHVSPWLDMKICWLTLVGLLPMWKRQRPASVHKPEHKKGEL